MTRDRSDDGEWGIDLSRRDYVSGIGALGLLSVVGAETAAAAPSVVDVGTVGYADGVPSHVTASEYVDAPPAPEYTTGDVSAPYPTNDWWSRLLTVEHAETLFSHPIFTEPTSSGLEIGYTDEWDVGSGSGVDMKDNPVTPYMDMGDTPYMPFEPDFTIGHTATGSFDQSLVDGYGDWHVTYRMGSSAPSMTVTQVKGSPYLYLDYSGGGTELDFTSAPTVFEDRGDAIGISVNGHHYGLFGPDGSSWSGLGSSTLSNDLGSEGYVTVALLPDATSSTFDTFVQYAHNFVTDTRIDWEYVEQEGGQLVSEVRTTFDFSVDDRTDSGGSGTIAALYPHQHKYLQAGESLLDGLSYESPRGTMKLSQGGSFTTALPYSGILPNYPVMDSIADTDQLSQYAIGISTPTEELSDLADKYGVPTLPNAPVDWTRLPYNAGKSTPYGNTYWTGLNFNRWSEAAALLNELGETDRRDLVLDYMQGAYQQWFTPKGDLDYGDDEFDSNMFFYDHDWGTLTGHLGGFNAYSELNDHHFHYGYFVKGASEVARFNDEWAADSNYGGMIKLLIKEFANPNRDDDMFPFLRNFSPYAGHSWASGINPFHLGNNQEASSEAISAYAGLIRWGAFTDQEIDGTSIEELGIFLYTHEIYAALEYWYDWEEENHPDEWDREYASVVWGDGYSHSTWWTEDAEDTYAINVIPANGDSLYLGWDEDHAGLVYDELVDLKGDEKFETWPGILTEFQGFSDPSSALDRFQDWEDGNYPVGSYYVPDLSNSKLHTYTMLQALSELGTPTRQLNGEPIVSNATFSHVFLDESGSEPQRNYVVYNPDDTESVYKFSDGTGFTVPANSLAIQRGRKPIDQTPPEAPTDLTVTGHTDTTVSLSWTESPSDDVTGYNVYAGETVVAEASGSSTTVSGLASATEYSLTLVAVDDGFNESTEAAGPVTVVTAVNSEDYTQEAAEVDETTHSFTFTPAHETASVELTYTVDGGPESTVALSDDDGDGTWTASVGGFSEGEVVEYHYTFEKGGNYFDTTQFSDEFEYVPDQNPPTVPSDLSSPASTETSIDLTWGGSTDSGTGLDHYVVYLDGSKTRTIPAGTTSTTLSGLRADTTYTVGVSAVDGAGNESDTATGSFSTKTPIGGEDWSASLEETSSSELLVEFDHDADAAWADLHYSVNQGAQQNVGMTAQTSSHTYTITGLSSDDSIEFYFTYEEGGLAYDTSSFTYDFGGQDPGEDTTAPTVPSGVSSPSHDRESLTVTWTASTDEGGSGMDHYVVQAPHDGPTDEVFAEQVPTGTTEATMTGLYADTTYSVSVKAVDGAGNESAFSTSISVTTDGDETAPTAPTNLRTTASTETSVELAWDAASDTGGSGLDHYVVYVDGSKTQEVAAGTTSATVSGLSSGTTHEVSVSAVDGAGNESTRAGPITVLEDVTPPTDPANLTSPAQSSTTIDLSWDASSDAGTGVDHYNVYEGSTDTPVVATASSTSTTMSSLSADTQYTYLVTAVDGAGNESGPSNTVTASTDKSSPGKQITGPDWVATLEPVSASEVAVEFDRSPDSQWVDIHYTVDGGSQLNVRMTAASGAHTYTIDGLSSGATIEFYFTYEDGGLAYDTDSYSYEFGDTVEDTTAPTVPSNLSTSSVGSSSVTLDWTAAEDTGTGVARYEVYTDGTLSTEVTAGTTSATVSGLAPATSYDFRVQAFDGAGNASGKSDPLTVETDPDSGDPTWSGDGWTATLVDASDGYRVEFDHQNDSQWVDIHYTVDGGTQQNVRMTAQSGYHSHTVSGLSAGDVLTFSFTYEEGGLAYDTSSYTHEVTQ